MNENQPKTPCRGLRAHLLGNADAAQREAFEAHLASCATCAAEVRSWARVNGAIQDWSRARPVPEASPFVARSLVRAAAGSPSSRTGGRIALRPALAVAATLAAAAAVALVVGFTGEWGAGGLAKLPPIEPQLVHAEGGVIRLAPGSKQASLTVAGEGRLLAAVGGDRIALGARSDARVSRTTGGGLRIDLLRGTVAVAAQKRPHDAALAVAAGGYRVEVVGTRFSVAMLDRSGLEIAVDEGAVRVVSIDGSSRPVAHGQLMKIAASGHEEVTALDPATAGALDGLLEAPPDEDPVAAVEPAADALVEVFDVGAADTGTAGTALPAPRPEPASYPRLEEVRRWILSGDLDKAEAVLEVHLGKYPRDVEAWTLLANCRRKAGNYGEAVAGLRKVIEYGNGAQSNRARFSAASVLQDNMARDGEAAALLEAYLDRPTALKPLESEAMLRLARALLRTGRTGEAHAIIEKLNVRFPGTSAALQAQQLLPGEPAPTPH